MEYLFKPIETKWQRFWAEGETFRTQDDYSRPKYYVLDMFPYPSGAGLHVGHPLGYIASDIVARYKRLQGFNVLHPMGYDAFGLPAEQYAIQTGQPPAVTTSNNIARYRQQLDRLGFSFDWSRAVNTSDPKFYKWTQWIFLKLFDSWYNQKIDKAEPLSVLIEAFRTGGSNAVKAAGGGSSFTSDEWNSFNEVRQRKILMEYRLAYLGESSVNWCAELGTVLANEEVKDGYSERGGFPVIKRRMQQWFLRITAYAPRLLDGLNQLDWSDAVKEMQRNWIGKSQGATIRFKVANHDVEIEVFTTRPDTIFGCTFLVLAPEYDAAPGLISPDQKAKFEKYLLETTVRSERERMADLKRVSGVFTGAYALHPFTDNRLPIYVADYVLAGYGTGATMAVPSGDERDFRFAQLFDLPIIATMSGQSSLHCYAGKDGTLVNSSFLNGRSVEDATEVVIDKLADQKVGQGKLNFRLRDAGFSRQRYWGEPFPIFYREDEPYALSEEKLPLILPKVDSYLPTREGEPPLSRAAGWQNEDGFRFETSTMPGWAGSSWYFIRYMDPHNAAAVASKKNTTYWGQVDLYVGGSEHATGHLIYFRFWTKFLFDLGLIPFEEPALKLVNQGMIQGRSAITYRLRGTSIYLSQEVAGMLKSDPDAFEKHIEEPFQETCEKLSALILSTVGNEAYLLAKLALDGNQMPGPISHFPLQAVHVDVNLVNHDVLDRDAYRKGHPDAANALFIAKEDSFKVNLEVEKMSKSKLNVVNPDTVIDQYGADTLRMYEMFLGPLELAKPWDTNGIEGVYKFLKKFWRLFQDEKGYRLNDDTPSPDALKTLHKLIKKITEDLGRLSLNTSVSSFMIAVNELTLSAGGSRVVLEPLIVLLSPFAPHVCEELWAMAGHEPGSVGNASWPVFNEVYLQESSFKYPVSINGKVKFTAEFAFDFNDDEIRKAIVKRPEVERILSGSAPKKIIVVSGRIINIVT